MRAFLRTALFLLILLLMLQLLIAASRPKPDSGTEMMRLMYRQPRRLDVVVCGQSQVFCGYNAGMLAEELSANAYLLSSPMQNIRDSYYLLKEALKHHEIGTLLLQVNTYWFLPIDGEFGRATALRLLYQMPPSLNRLQYALDAVGSPFFVAAIEEAAKDQIGTVRGLLGLAPLKQLLKPDEYIRWNPGDGRYFDRGFATAQTAQSPDAPVNPPPPPSEPDPEALSYLDRFMRLCDESGIRVIWVTSPYPMNALIQQGRYDEEYQAIRRLAEQYKVPYWNFNLARRDALPLELSDFSDYRHTNLSGANKLTALVCELLEADREGKDTAYAFCASFAERAAEG